MLSGSCGVRRAPRGGSRAGKRESMRCLHQVTALVALCVTVGAGCGTRADPPGVALEGVALEALAACDPAPMAPVLDPGAQAFVDRIEAQGGPPISSLPVQ